MVKKRPTVNLGLADKIVDDGGIDPELQQTPAASEEPEQVSQKPPKKLAKSKDPDYQRTTVYLKKEQLIQVKQRLITQPGVDMSDLIALAISEYLAKI